MLLPVLWRMAVWGAFLLLGLVAVGVTGLPAGGPGGAFATATRIAREGVPTIGGETTLVGPLDGAARGLAYYRGDYWHAAPPGAALLAVPAAWFGVPLADTTADPGAAVLVVGLTGVFLLLAVAAALAWAGERMDILPRVALLAAVLGVGTLLWPVGTLTNTTALVAIVGVLVAITLADGADARVEAGWTPRGRLAMSGLLLGLLPFVTTFAPVPLLLVPLVLMAWGGRNWWKRVGYLAAGATPPLLAYAPLMTVWFGRPWGAAWQYALTTGGAGWQRTLTGRYFANPGLAATEAAGAFVGLLVQHPLLLVGWGGLVLGLAYVPWRTRTSLVALLLAFGVPGFLERQLPGTVAAEHPVASLTPFAAAGYLLLAGVVTRDRVRMLPVVFGGGAGLFALGLLIGAATRDGRAAIIPAGGTPAAYVVPLALCAAAVLLLAFPAIALPRRGRRSGTGGAGSGGERTQAMRLGGVGLLLLPLVLVACGRAAVAPLPESTAPLLTNLAPPFAVRGGAGVTEAVWRLAGGLIPTPDGSSLVAGSGPGTATAPRVPVGGGDRYRLSLRVIYPGGTGGGMLAAQWLDANNVALGEERVPLEIETTRIVAAVPGAAAVRLALSLPSGAAAGDLRLAPLDGGRLDPWPDYHRAAFAFTFDWETAMGGLIHTRGGVREHDVADAESRAGRMRQGAVILRRQFDIYGIKATWYVNGYNFLTGNTARRQFMGNPTYTRYSPTNAGFRTDYWTRNPWFGDDPYGTEGTHPAWYFGTLTQEFAAGGQDIQSHTFAHIFLASGVTPQQLDDDLTAYDTVAREAGLPPATSFAFPWGASNKLTDEYYAVFAAHGIAGVTRFYDLPAGLYELGNVPQRPAIRVLPDTELEVGAGNEEFANRRGDEAAARRGIDLTLAGGGAWSLWTHPESVTTPAAQTLWERAIGYAAAQRDNGLWIAPASQIVAYANARDALRVQSVRVGEQTTITVTNTGPTPVAGATLTLPRAPERVVFAGGSGLPDRQGAQVRLGTLGAGQRIALTVR